MSNSNSSDSSKGYESRRRRRSSGGEAARVVQELLREDAERQARQEEEERREPRNRLLPLPVVALLWGMACLLVWAATPQFLLPEPLPEPTPAQIETGLRMELLSAVTAIERYRERTGRVPETLDRAMDYPSSSVRYSSASTESYRLSGSRAGAYVVYESADSIEDLVNEVRRRIRDGSGGGG